MSIETANLPEMAHLHAIVSLILPKGEKNAEETMSTIIHMEPFVIAIFSAVLTEDVLVD